MFLGGVYRTAERRTSHLDERISTKSVCLPSEPESGGWEGCATDSGVDVAAPGPSVSTAGVGAGRGASVTDAGIFVPTSAGTGAHVAHATMNQVGECRRGSPNGRGDKLRFD